MNYCEHCKVTEDLLTTCMICGKRYCEHCGSKWLPLCKECEPALIVDKKIVTCECCGHQNKIVLGARINEMFRRK